jgi:hypothetical protein
MRQSGHGGGDTYRRILEVDSIKLRTRRASWFLSGLLLFAVVSAGSDVVVAQPKNETSTPMFDMSQATFESLGEDKIVKLNNIAYTSDENGLVNIYFSCSLIN